MCHKNELLSLFLVKVSFSFSTFSDTKSTRADYVLVVCIKAIICFLAWFLLLAGIAREYWRNSIKLLTELVQLIPLSLGLCLKYFNLIMRASSSPPVPALERGTRDRLWLLVAGMDLISSERWSLLTDLTSLCRGPSDRQHQIIQLLGLGWCW